jgi:hypothetical protein
MRAESRAPRPGSGQAAARYEHDFYEWAAAQAGAVREGRWADIDVDNLAGEIDEMAGSVETELKQHVRF